MTACVRFPQLHTPVLRKTIKHSTHFLQVSIANPTKNQKHETPFFPMCFFGTQLPPVHQLRHVLPKRFDRPSLGRLVPLHRLAAARLVPSAGGHRRHRRTLRRRLLGPRRHHGQEEQGGDRSRAERWPKVRSSFSWAVRLRKSIDCGDRMRISKNWELSFLGLSSSKKWMV